MALGSTEAFRAPGLNQVTPQQVAITQRSTELISGVMVELVGGRNNPDKGLPSVRNIPSFKSGVGARIDYHA